MEFTQIPNLKQKVSRIGLGTWAIGGWMWGGTDEKNAIACIHHALDIGINLIDTAPAYGFGMSEEIVGKAIKQYGKRDQMVIATKTGLTQKGSHDVVRDARKKTILKEIEDSLKRLQVDYIDLYQVHWPDPLVPVAETAEAMDQLMRQGKIRAIGVSNFSIEEMDDFQKKAPLHSLQSPYNLFESEIEKNELNYCLKKGIAILGYGSICRGLLSGKMKKHAAFTGDDLRKVDPKFQEPRFSHYLQCVERLDAWAQKKYQRTVLALAMRWSLDKGVHVALWGAREPSQFNALDDVWGWKLSPQDFQAIDKILKDSIQSPIGPEFMAPPSRNKVKKIA